MVETILEIDELHTYFFTDRGPIPAVDGISLKIHAGEIVGVVGESGCGKSVTSLSVMRLLPQPPGKIVNGKILLRQNGHTLDLVRIPERKMRKIRGNDISMIFQEPMTSLNPVFTIGNQLIETIKIHKKLTKKKAREFVIDQLQKVGIPRAEQIMDEYPHQLSGGMRQRVMIAMAMSCEPKLLIADEPTTALDVTIQAQMLELMKELNRIHGTAILLITHDLGVVAEICHRLIVMYGGKIVEEGNIREILHYPRHPYTKGLLRSIPKLHEKEQRLYSIPGNVPRPGSIQTGCRFAPRCSEAFERCMVEEPELVDIAPGRSCRCFLYD